MSEMYIRKLNKSESDIDCIVNWFKQPDRSWLYCDSPVDPNIDYSIFKEGLKQILNSSPESRKVDYYMIRLKYNNIGFAIVRQEDLEYFSEVKGISVGLDIINGNERGKGYGSIALRKLLLDLKKDRRGINQVYLETLSYNEAMKKVAERVGFKQIDSKELGTKYQRGFEEHIEDISRCLNKTPEELKNQKVFALLYMLDLGKWPNVELKEISEVDKGLFDNVDFYSDYVDASSFDYKTDEKFVEFALYDKNILIGGIKTEFDVNNNSAEISDFFILNKYQEFGYGRMALNKTIDYIKTNSRIKIDKVILEVCSENIPALNLYWKTGFRPVDYDSGKWKMELLI